MYKYIIDGYCLRQTNTETEPEATTNCSISECIGLPIA